MKNLNSNKSGKYYVIVSNPGNHTGFNRSWDRLLETEEPSIARSFLISYAINHLSDDIVSRNGRPYDLSTNRYVVTNEMLSRSGSFEYDGRTYAIVHSSDVEYFFNGYSNGYIPSFINTEEDS